MRILVVGLAALALPLLSACGGGGTQSAGGLQIGVFQPSTAYSHAATPFRIIGSGFGVRKEKVVVRLTAATGTPFAGGTSSTLEVEGTLDSDQQVRGTIPATLITTSFEATAMVILASGETVSTPGNVLSFVAQEVISISPDSTVSGTQPPFTITGRGFQPVLGLATVRFTAASGQPFAGGTTSVVQTIATVSSDTTVTGLLPDTQAAFDADAYVTVTLPSGATMTSALPIMHFLPVPTVLTFNPPTLQGGTPTAVTVGGTAYEPVGGTAFVTITATTGTPFFNGTTDSVQFAATIDSPIQLSGTVPALLPNAGGLAYVTVDLPGGASVTSATPLASFAPPPSLNAIVPSMMESGSDNPWDSSGPPVNFLITGTNFGTVGATVALTFTAASGTPFNNGTSATFTAAATVLSGTEMAGTISDPLAAAAAQTQVSAVFQSGALASSVASFFDVDVMPPFVGPAFDNAAINTASLVTGFSDDNTRPGTFASGFTFPFYSGSWTTSNIASNGALQFGTAYSGFNPAASVYTSSVRGIGLWHEDLNPASGGSIYFDSTTYSHKHVLTFNAVRYFGSTNSITFQCHIYDTGRIDCHWQTIVEAGGIIGIGNAAGTLSNVDFSAVSFPTHSNSGGAFAPYEQSAQDMANRWLIYYPDGTGGYDWGSGS